MYKLGDIVFTKKNHVCGSNRWKIIRTGVDIKLECLECKRIIMIPSFELDKKVKPILSKKELIIKEKYNKSMGKE